MQVLASKILIDWLRNRQQLLVPLTLDLQKLEPAEVEVVLHAMVTAAQADGAGDARGSERLGAALERVNATAEHRGMLSELLEHPKALRRVLGSVGDVKTGAIVYAASLLSIDRRNRVNRRYLRYLAARLRLPEALSRNLERRFVAPM